MNKELAEYLINYSLDTGADFSEIFYEKTIGTDIRFLNKKIDNVETNVTEGIGIRLALGDTTFYANTNILTKENLTKIIDELKSNFNLRVKFKNIKLKNESHNSEFFDISSEDKKEYLYKVDKIAREKDERITEVISRFSEKKRKIIIASSKGKYIEEDRNYLIFRFSVYASENGKKEEGYKSYGYSTGYEFIKNINIEKEIESVVDIAIKKLSSIYIKGGKMPVVIANGWGAVIFHEACGHAMEATGVAKKLSILTDKIGQKIASEKVTIIDDGTIPNLWGTTYYDDEGNKTRKNILIEKGVLKSYLVDEINDRKMKHGITGSGRRQSYRLAPTSRMNNTYLAPGTDKFEDMIKDIKYGLYAKQFIGGSVDSTTGDFNFSVDEGYLIKNGKVCEPVKMASLIGNTLEILNNVDMVSDDLDFGVGFCGSLSGKINVTTGQPTIRVSSILVGGASND